MGLINIGVSEVPCTCQCNGAGRWGGAGIHVISGCVWEGVSGRDELLNRGTH